MKKLILFCLCFVILTPVFAQEIAFRTDNDNVFSIGANYMIEKGNVAVGLTYMIDKNTEEETYQIAMATISYELAFSFDKGAKALIRTFAGNIIELSQIKNCHDIGRESKRAYSGSSTYYYYCYPYFEVSHDDLKTMMQEGIQKIRFETTIGMIDYSYEKDELGKLLKKEYDLILSKSKFDTDF